MRRAQREAFEKAGWKIGSPSELLGLTDAETALVEAKLRLGEAVRALRALGKLSQKDLAKRMGSSQPRIAKLENRDPEVSMDLQMKAVFAASPEAGQEFRVLVERWISGSPPSGKRHLERPQPARHIHHPRASARVVRKK
jgi:DNA-binding XRE family transcriptional regulator